MSKTHILAGLILDFEERFKKIPCKKELKQLEEEANIIWAKMQQRERITKGKNNGT